MGSTAGVIKTAAVRLGLSVAEYEALRSSGKKWCTGCKAWHSIAAFPQDRSRGDGRRSKCLTSQHGVPNKNRNPEHEVARKAVAYAVRTGRMPRPNSLPCTDCGHRWSDGERRHEYDHHLGYAPKNRLNVQAVCTTCHADRERMRRNG